MAFPLIARVAALLLKRRGGSRSSGSEPSAAIKVTIQGDKEVARYLAEMASKLANPKKFLVRTGLMVSREFQRGMTGGRARRLAPVERWTRVFRHGVGTPRGRITPLVATGGLRNSIGILSVSNRHVEIGHRGRYAQVSSSMESGRRGWMRVKPEKVRTARDGHRYIRVRSNSGQWYTKKVVGGAVSVKPKKRRYFYLMKHQREKIVIAMGKYVQKVTK